VLIPFDQPLQGSHNRGSLRLAARLRTESQVHHQSRLNAHRHGIEVEIVRFDGRPIEESDLNTLGLEKWDVLKWVDDPVRQRELIQKSEYPELADGYRIVGGQATVDESQNNAVRILFAIVRKPLDAKLFQREKREPATV
jgi:hypothetical protein